MAMIEKAWPHVRLIASKWRGETAIVAGSYALGSLLRIVSAVTLSRLLSPEVFGVIGVLTSISYTIVMISDVGIQAFVIRHEKGDDRHFRNALWTFRFLRSLFLTLALVALAGPLAAMLAKPELASAIRVYSLTFVLEGATSLAIVSAYRHRQLFRLNALELVTSVVQLTVSILLALQYPTYWSVVAAMLIAAAVRAVLTYFVFPDTRQHFVFDRRYVVELLKFARYITGSSIITLLLSQTDKLVLSRLFSLHMFGLYMIAASLAAVPAAFAQNYAHQLLYPRYAQFWRASPSTFRASYYATKRVVSNLYVFAVGGVIGSAPLVVEILYDDRYRDVSIYLSLLSIGTMLAMNNLAMMNALVAIGQPEVTFRCNLVRLVWFAILFPAAYFLVGPLGVILVVATVEIPAMIYQWYHMGKAGLLSRRREFELLAAGAAGIAIGWLGCQILLPVIRYFA